MKQAHHKQELIDKKKYFPEEFDIMADEKESLVRPIDFQGESKYSRADASAVVFGRPSNTSVIYKDIWRLNDKFSQEEINVYHKKVQYVQNIIQESEQDLIISGVICVIAIVSQYLLSSVILMNLPMILRENSLTSYIASFMQI